MHRSPLACCSAAALLSLCGCGGGEPAAAPPSVATPAPAQASAQKPLPAAKLDFAEIKRLFAHDPKAPPPPVAATAAMVQLGRTLYHDQRLSQRGNLSCASCHDLARHGVDGRPTSPGSTGENGARNTPTSINAFRHFVQFWDGRAASVEAQAIGPVLNPIEHGIADEAALLALLRAEPGLVTAFQAAFGAGDDAVSVANFQTAIGAFERTLVTRSRWDDFVDGDRGALSAVEKQGLDIFMQTGCTECHYTRMLGGDSFQVLGKARRFPVADQGRFALTGNDADKQVFKVPALVGVADTAPYFHDGSKATLAETVATMADVQLGKRLEKTQVDAVVAFLQATSGPLPKGVLSD